MEISPHIFPLGDAALTLDLGNRIDPDLNKMAIAVGAWMNNQQFPGVKDVIVAYSSVSVFYDLYIVRFDIMRTRLENAFTTILAAGAAATQPSDNPVIRIPVCYEADYAPDLDALAAAKGLSRETVIDLHIQPVYRVYMIGFLPGFPYLGIVDDRIATARKERPVPVAAGSVGIAGGQTGIYPCASPGGWQIIGRTPIRLFDASAGMPAFLRLGDQVQFYPIRPDEFTKMW